MLRSSFRILLCFSLLFSFALGCSASSGPPEAVVTATSGLILRTGPGTQHKALVTLPLGASVQILDSEGPLETIGGETAHWKKVMHGDEEGWVFSAFLADPKSESARKILSCIESNGTWQSPYCYDARLVAVTQNFTVNGYCGGKHTLRPDGTVYVHGGYIGNPYSIRWTFETGDSIWIRENGFSIRARLASGKVIWEQKSYPDAPWEAYPGPCDS